MAREVYEFQITVPAGTAQSSPQTSPMTMPPRVVEQLEVLVPPGPGGEVGFAIGSSGGQVIPRNAGTYVISDDEKITWPLDGMIDSGAWQLVAYNTGRYDHTLYVRFLVDLVGAQPATSAPLDTSQLAGQAPAAPVGAVPPLGTITPPTLAPPTLPTMMPPIAPALAPPGSNAFVDARPGRAQVEWVRQYGGAEHVFWVDGTGALQHRWQPPGGAAGGTSGWNVEHWDWAGGLTPFGLINGDIVAGQVHVFAPKPGGSILHLAASTAETGPTAWGGEVIGGAGGS